MSEITTEAVEVSYLLDEWDAVVDEEASCFTCADPLDAGDQAVDVRVPEVGKGAVTTIHLRCYQGEDVLDTGEHR